MSKSIPLNLGERFALLGILPTEGNFATLKIVRELRERLSLTEEEHKEYNVQQIGDQIRWSNAEKTKAIEFGDIAFDLIVKRLKELDKAGTLEDRHFTIYEKFVESKTE